MITPIDRSQLHLVRGCAAANAPRLLPAADAKAASPGSEPAEKVHQMVIDAYEGGLAAGEDQHFRSGWRWGVAAGLVPGALLFYAAQKLLQWAGLL